MLLRMGAKLIRQPILSDFHLLWKTFLEKREKTNYDHHGTQDKFDYLLCHLQMGKSDDKETPMMAFFCALLVFSVRRCLC